MTDTPTTNIDLVRTLIRAVDDQTTTPSLRSRRKTCISVSEVPTPPTPSPSYSLQRVPFVLRLPICTTLSVNVWEVDDGIVSPPWTSTIGDSTIVN